MHGQARPQREPSGRRSPLFGAAEYWISSLPAKPLRVCAFNSVPFEGVWLDTEFSTGTGIAFTLVEQQKSSNSKVGNFGYGKLAPAGFICVQGSRERRQLQHFAAAMRSITGGLHDSSTAPRTRLGLQDAKFKECLKRNRRDMVSTPPCRLRLVN